VNPVKKTFEFEGGSTVTLETGRIARQATSAVLVTMDDTSVLVTVMADKEPSPMPFFPLAVHYVEKTYSVGKIPGGFLEAGRPALREGNPDLAPDRPAHPAAVRGRFQERNPGHLYRHVLEQERGSGHSGHDRCLRGAVHLRAAV